MTRRRVLLSVLALLLHAAPLAGQAARIEEGARLRVGLASGRSVVATLIGVGTDTIVLGREGPVPATLPVPLESVRRLEVSTGTRSLAPFGVLGGGVLAGILVASYNGIRSSQCFRDCDFDSASGVLWVGVGALVGGASLWFVRVDRWVEIAIPVGGGRRD